MSNDKKQTPEDAAEALQPFGNDNGWGAEIWSEGFLAGVRWRGEHPKAPDAWVMLERSDWDSLQERIAELEAELTK